MSHDRERDALMRELRQAIERAFAESENVHEVLEKIQEAGYEVTIGMAIMVYLERKKFGSAKEKKSDSERPLEFKLTEKDKEFLRSLNLEFIEDDSD